MRVVQNTLSIATVESGQLALQVEQDSQLESGGHLIVAQRMEEAN